MSMRSPSGFGIQNIKDINFAVTEKVITKIIKTPEIA